MGKIFGEKLKEFIAQSGLSEAEWAKLHGFPQRSVNSWVNGKRNCLLKNARRIAVACGCKLSDISSYSVDDTAEEVKSRFAFISKLSSYEYSELVNAYEDGRLDLSQIAKSDDIENFRDRAIAAIARLDISADIKGKVIDLISKLDQIKETP